MTGAMFRSRSLGHTKLRDRMACELWLKNNYEAARPNDASARPQNLSLD